MKRRATRFFVKDNPKSPISEAFRTLRTNLSFTSVDKEIKIIGVTSTKPREGKSTVAFNLATTLALNGNKTLLVDADLRKPQIHRFINNPNTNGLTSVLTDSYDKITITKLYEKEFEDLGVVTSGPIPPNPSELLASKRMKYFVDSVKEHFEYIIFDTPPIGSVSDCAVLSPFLDGIIIVAESGNVTRAELNRTKESLLKVNANILGVVLNGVKRETLGYDYYYSYDD